MLYESPSSDPFFNLALEHYFMEAWALEKSVLLLYRNAPSVVIGKNQNPWLETSPAFLAQNKINLVRRYSGGGAVYHDPGNLNLSLILPSGLGRKELLFSLLQSILDRAGLKNSEVKGNSLFYKQKKISGSAYYYKKQRALLQCTLLVDANLAMLHESLKAEADLEINSCAVNSLRALVANCRDFDPDLSVSRITGIIKALLPQNNYNTEEARLFLEPAFLSKIQAFREELRSWNWVFGKTPQFECRMNLAHSEKNPKKVSMTIKINCGIIDQISINDDIISKIKNYSGLIHQQNRVFDAGVIKSML
ncbi:MAG: hypothetical protein JXR70_16215 [Spirochaetales bacterium]|nr:hypothetical protein [Spirochaetales bacterium]